jgi:hypothetical protein
MVKEIFSWKAPSFPNSIRAKPDEWNMKRLSLSWTLSLEGKGLAPKRKNLAKDYFKSSHSSKDGWKLSRCNNQKLRDVLEFLVPFINPNNPKRVTIQMASTVVDCLIHKTKISWAKGFKHNIKTKVDKVSSVAISYLAAYVVNLHVKDNILTKAEKKEWEDLKWSLDQGFKWTFANTDEEENPDKEDEAMEMDEDKELISESTPRRKLTSRTLREVCRHEED